MIDNIDDLSERARNLKLTRNGFIDYMRQITCRKIQGIKVAKDVFEATIEKLVSAQEYELRNQ